MWGTFSASAVLSATADLLAGPGPAFWITVVRVRRTDRCPRIGEPERAGRAAPAIADIAAEVEAGPIIEGIGEGAGCANGENGNRECGSNSRAVEATAWRRAGIRLLLVTGATHGDAAQAIAADLARGAEREVENPAACERAAVLHRAADLLAVLEIGDDEDGAKSLGAMRARDLVGLEALAARVPLVLPVDGGFLIVCRRPRDPPHPLFLKGVGACVRRGQRQCQRRKRQPGSTAAIAVAIPCHDANILLRAGLLPAGGSIRTFLFDFGAGVAGVGRHCVGLGNPDETSHGGNNENNMCFAAAAWRARIHGMARERRIEMRSHD